MTKDVSSLIELLDLNQLISIKSVSYCLYRIYCGRVIQIALARVVDTRKVE